MNLTELKHLHSDRLSHLSRSLYLLYLRPAREKGELRADLYAISNYLAVPHARTRTEPDLALAALCLDELKDEGLIAPLDQNSPDSWQNVLLSLPFFEAELTVLPQRVFRMQSGWRPSANFNDTCILAGLEESSFSEAELHGFVSYWQGTTEMRNQAAWERSFAQRLKKQRSARSANAGRSTPQAFGTAAHPMAERGIPRAE